MGTDIPEQDARDKNDPNKDYHSFIIRKANKIFQSSIIKRVITSSYQGLFVDEYQDCTKPQHAMIMELANVLSTHILADPLQGIFDFNDEPVDLETDLSDFEKFPELETPHRWYKEGNNKDLGDLIKSYRQPLLQGESITVASNTNSCFYVFDVSNSDFADAKSDYRKKMISLVQNKKNNQSLESLLIIVPEYDELENGHKVRKGKIIDRARILTQIDFSKSVTLLEAIDDLSFYNHAKNIDDIISTLQGARKPIKKVTRYISKIFCKTSPKRLKNIGLNDWISTSPNVHNGDLYIKNKNAEYKALSDKLSLLINCLISNPSTQNMYGLLVFIRDDLNIKKQPRSELLNSIMKALQNSIHENITVHEAMKAHKNIVRRIGRKIDGKCIGTTLLTKGLEFDTVVILDAHRFDCPKHLYVAFTRCCKNLIIFTSQKTLSPYGG